MVGGLLLYGCIQAVAITLGQRSHPYTFDMKTMYVSVLACIVSCSDKM